MRRQPYLAFIIVCGSVFVFIIGLRAIGALEYLELTAYDMLVRWRPKIQVKHSHVTLIRIGEDDIRSYHWPLTDAVLARALTDLVKYRPRAIGLDIFRDLPVQPGEEELRDAMTENRNIIATMKFGKVDDSGIPPPAALDGTDQVGFNDILVDPGGIVRRGLLFLDDGTQVYSSFALRMAALYLAKENVIPQSDPVIPDHIRLGNVTVKPFEAGNGGYVRADDQGYQFLLDYQRGSDPFPSYSLNQLLTGDVDPADITGKVIIIGFDSEGVKDFFYTPFSRRLKYDQQIAGIALHAQITDQLIRFGLGESRVLNSLSESYETFFLLLCCALGTGLSSWIRSIWPTTLAVFLGVLALCLVSYLSFSEGVWIIVIAPILAFVYSAGILTAYISAAEKKERTMLMQLFSKHVSPEIAEDIWRQRGLFLKEGRPIPQKLTDTVLFADLSGFTAVSEKMVPQELLQWLNTFMESMSNIIMEHDGVIDKFIGDGLKADFGVPLPRTSQEEIKKDARNAVNCSLEMERELYRLNDIWRTESLPNVRMRIGINTGQVVAGSLGSSRRLQYTTIGDTVNIASRLESLDLPEDAKAAGSSQCRILVGETTYRLLDGCVPAERVGEFELKGRRGKTAVYRVVGKNKPMNEEIRDDS